MWISTHQVVRLTLILFYFFLHIYDYAVLDSGYYETSGSCGGFDPRDA
jgi:hypothetical protein